MLFWSSVRTAALAAAIAAGGAGMAAQADKIALPKESPAGEVVAQSPKTQDTRKATETIAKYLANGTSCSYGWRYVRVTVDGQSQTIGEGTTWPIFTDTKSTGAMRELYTALRKMAVETK